MREPRGPAARPTQERRRSAEAARSFPSPQCTLSSLGASRRERGGGGDAARAARGRARGARRRRGPDDPGPQNEGVPQGGCRKRNRHGIARTDGVLDHDARASEAEVLHGRVTLPALFHVCDEDAKRNLRARVRPEGAVGPAPGALPGELRGVVALLARLARLARAHLRGENCNTRMRVGILLVPQVTIRRLPRNLSPEPATMTQDTRKDRRVKIVSLNVRYKSATVDEFIENHAHDVSRGGIYIKTANPFPSGTLLKFEIRLASDQAVITGVGRVVWQRDTTHGTSDRPSGMGAKVIKVDDTSKAIIDRLVTTKADAGKAYESEPDATVPQQTSRESAPRQPIAPPKVSPPGPASTAPARKATAIGLGAASGGPPSFGAARPAPEPAMAT